MGRPEVPLDPEHDPLHAFADRLRRLRTEAGRPTYQAMSRAAGRSVAALSGAARGEELPTWQTVTAYVAVCGGRPDEFLAAWEHLRDLRARTALPEPATQVGHVAGLTNLPQPPVPSFVGRDDSLAALTVGLETHKGVAVHGLGGVGKTELAVQFAYRRSFALTWWITADSEDNVAAALAGLTRALNPGWPAAAGTADATAWARQWLASHDDWLVVLDNVADLGVVRPLAATAVNGRLLVTTRRDLSWAELGLATLHLGPLTRPASLDLLRQWSGRRGEPVAAAELAADVGDLPLALRQAAAYLRERPNISVLDYRRRLARQPLRILGAPASVRDGHPVARTWQVTVAALTSQNPDAGRLLDLIAYLAPDAIDLDLLGASGGDALDIEDAVALLASYHMVNLSEAGISVHRLVQTMARAEHDSATPALAAVRAVGSLAPGGNPETDLVSWPRWARLAPHVEALAGHLAGVELLRANPELQLAAAGLFTACAVYHRGQGRYGTAVSLLEQASATRRELLGPDHPDTLTSRYCLGGAYWSTGRYAECLEIGEATLSARRRVLGREHPDTLANASNIAVGYRELGRHEEAIALSEATLEARERVFGPDHPDTLQSRNNLAGCYRAVGRHEEAIRLYEATLDARRRTVGDLHPDTLQSRNNLAGGLRALGRHDEAIELHESTLVLRKEVLGREHPDTLHSMYNLAETYVASGRRTEAAKLFRTIREARKRLLGPDHPDTVRAGEMLASIKRRSA
ncbi:tetratricopeptide repeat-containing protein [Actinoplanes sp. NPDC049596]|uniref:tetratricopeptide repeat-containing protein n=1 Tax=unclassified Actinoplanes TaxID=2626549 RepID=UPI0034480956